MMDYKKKLQEFIEKDEIQAESLTFEKTCRTVEDAAKAVGAKASDFVKSIVFTDGTDFPIVFIVSGDDHLDGSKVSSIVGTSSLRMARAEEILELTGYPLGGVPPFGFQGDFFVDRKVLEKEQVFAGGGAENSLIKVPVDEILQATTAKIVDVRKE